jgi:hypothetical protein
MISSKLSFQIFNNKKIPIFKQEIRVLHTSSQTTIKEIIYSGGHRVLQMSFESSQGHQRF